MNQAALAKLEISHDLSLLCGPELLALKIIIHKMVNKSANKSYTKSLQGIWQDKEFDRLNNNLETELSQVRAEMNAAILRRII